MRPENDAADAETTPWADELDITFCTHLTVVVPARLEFSCGQTRELELVLPRARLGGGGRRHRLNLRLLLDAAQDALCRTRSSLRPQRLSARSGGRWLALCAWPEAQAAG